VLGLTRETSPADFVRGCLEGVALRLAEIILLLNKVVQSNANENASDGSQDAQPCVIASGGALEANSTWRQMISDGSGLEMIFDKDTQAGTSRGIALMMALATSGATHLPTEDIQATIKNMANEHASDYWRPAIERHDKLLDAITPVV
jgi:sugar (pentulose or hexulose) kinase